jgi:hypothetical protein
LAAAAAAAAAEGEKLTAEERAWRKKMHLRVTTTTASLPSIVRTVRPRRTIGLCPSERDDLRRRAALFFLPLSVSLECRKKHKLKMHVRTFNIDDVMMLFSDVEEEEEEECSGEGGKRQVGISDGKEVLRSLAMWTRRHSGFPRSPICFQQHQNENSLRQWQSVAILRDQALFWAMGIQIGPYFAKQIGWTFSLRLY